MAKDNIKALIFDLGNVLINFDHTIAARRICKYSAKSIQEIFQFFFDSPLTGLFEEGKIQPEDFFTQVKKSLGLDLTYAEFLPIWNGIFFLSPSNRKVYSILKSLRQNYKTMLLSNINILHYQYLKENFPVFDVFNNIGTSFEMKARKPGLLFFQ